MLVVYLVSDLLNRCDGILFAAVDYRSKSSYSKRKPVCGMKIIDSRE